MASVKVRWSASETLRKQEVIQTGENPKTQRTFTVDLTELTPEQRQAIVVYVGVDRLGFGVLDMNRQSTFDETRKYGDYLDRESLYFDAEPTTDQIIEWIVNEVAEGNEAKAHKAKVEAGEQEEVEYKTALYDQYREQVETLIEVKDWDGLNTFSLKNLGNWAPPRKQGLHSMCREAMKEIKAERQHSEKEAWIASFGSDRLKRGVARGHDCQRCYVVERAAMEAPGWTVDFNDSAEWKERSCPTKDALDAAIVAEGVLNLGAVEIVWLTNPAADKVPAHDEYQYEDWEPYAEREAMVIRNYLGCYDLVQEVY